MHGILNSDLKFYTFPIKHISHLLLSEKKRDRQFVNHIMMNQNIYIITCLYQI